MNKQIFFLLSLIYCIAVSAIPAIQVGENKHVPVSVDITDVTQEYGVVDNSYFYYAVDIFNSSDVAARCSCAKLNQIHVNTEKYKADYYAWFVPFFVAAIGSAAGLGIAAFYEKAEKKQGEYLFGTALASIVAFMGRQIWISGDKTEFINQSFVEVDPIHTEEIACKECNYSDEQGCCIFDNDSELQEVPGYARMIIATKQPLQEAYYTIRSMYKDKTFYFVEIS